MTAAVAPALDLEARLGALGGEVAAVMRPLVRPLVERWEMVVGDDEQVHETARRWRMMAEALTQVADDERASLARVGGEWEGLAHGSFDRAVDDVVRDLTEISRRARDVAGLLDEAAVAVRRTEMVVRELIHELVEWAAISLAVSAAGAIITLGASVAAGAAAAAARAGIVSARIATQLAQLALELRRIDFALGIYQTWVKSLGLVQKRLVKAVQGYVVHALVPIDGDWKPPAIALAQIAVEPETCFEQGVDGPRW
ncbi:WXG100 family type VII secretion target [Nocardioides currus]|uniref:Outer membrane channel protein CpnT-like N-terminal domain-containing protein n=1 Tax=Nocardioides currus TaxID=2133958 RepID=A0A2R7YXY4_9ACTN|nr:hypothetical protein [Nocardioides currus]PUA81255.1 hypothetical protein C7S10_09490 [Nocardioides currus]